MKIRNFWKKNNRGQYIYIYTYAQNESMKNRSVESEVYEGSLCTIETFRFSFILKRIMIQFTVQIFDLYWPLVFPTIFS